MTQAPVSPHSAAYKYHQCSVQTGRGNRLGTNMTSPYEAAYDLLDPALQQALAEDGIRSDPTSANQFRIFWEQSI